MNHTTHKPKATMIGWAALLGTAAALLYLGSMIDDWSRDLTTNEADLDPQAADLALRPRDLAADPTDAATLIQNWVQRTPRWALVSADAKSDAVHLHLTHTTGLLRFTDDIHVTLSRQDDRTRVQARSKSRIGKGDFGQNPRNLRALTSALDAAGETEIVNNNESSAG